MIELSGNPNLGLSSPRLNVTSKLLFEILAVLVHSGLNVTGKLVSVESVSRDVKCHGAHECDVLC